MKIIVKAKPRANKEGVERIEQPSLDFSTSTKKMVEYKVSVKEAPVAGMANDAILKLLAKYFGVSKSRVKLCSGSTSKLKIYEIAE